MRKLVQFFSWWNSANWNTLFYTWHKGERVGSDQFGNVYYRAKSAVPQSIPERRWVIYKGYAEPSQIPPGWHGWMHHRDETPPEDGDYAMRDWERPHEENVTGSSKAYRPPGSIALGVKPKKQDASYSAWRPE